MLINYWAAEVGSQSISQVAQDLGFTDLFTFSKVFKRHTGMTPSFYSKHPPESFE